MGNSGKIVFIFCACILLHLGVCAQNSDAQRAKDHALVPRLENFYIGNYEEQRFDDENFKTENGSVRIEGHKFVIDYRLQAKQTSKGKNFILTSFQKSLNNAETTQLLSGPYYSVFKINQARKEIWVKVDPLNTDGERYMVTIVEKEIMLQEVPTTAKGVEIKHAKDAKGSNDFAQLSRMPDFYIGRSEEKEQTMETFKTSHGSITVEGHKYYNDYYLEEGKVPPGKMQILENYKTALLDAGAEILLDGAYYDVYKIRTSGGEKWIKIDPGVYDGKRYEIIVVEIIDSRPHSSNSDRIIKTIKLEMTGFKPEDKIIKTIALQMSGFYPEDKIIRTTKLEMTGFSPEDRIIRTAKLEMTGFSSEDRIIKTAKLEMTGFNTEDRIIRTAKLEMTGFID